MQHFLKNQMENVKRQKEVILYKKSLDAAEVKTRTNEFLNQAKNKRVNQRTKITETQGYNKEEMNKRLDNMQA